MKTTLKSVLAIIAISVTSISASAQSFLYNPDQPVLKEDIYIDPATINNKLNYHNGIDLSEDYGHVFIPPMMYKHDGRSRGIFISRSCTSSYSAIEARCPRCFYKFQKTVTFEFHHVLEGECPVCGVQSDLFTFWGSSQLNHGGGDDKYNEIYLFDVYKVEEVEIDGQLYIKISNYPERITPPKNLPKKSSVPFYYPGSEPPEYRPRKIDTYIPPLQF